MLVNTVTKVNYDLMIELGEHFKEILRKANKIEVKSKNGTDLIAYHQGRKIRHSGQRATQKGYPIMLGGQTSWCPVEETINGTLVFDGALWPPAEIGKLHEPVKLTLENGVVTKIEGGAQAETFKAWLNLITMKIVKISTLFSGIQSWSYKTNRKNCRRRKEYSDVWNLVLEVRVKQLWKLAGMRQVIQMVFY